MPPKILIAMMGLPRSGKSTIAKSLGHPIVNPDSIRLALHGRAFIFESEGFVWAIAMLMVRYFFLMGHNTVVFDATNTTFERRDEINKINEWDTFFYEVKTDKAECLNRASKGGREDLMPIIERMEKDYQFLRPREKKYKDQFTK